MCQNVLQVQYSCTPQVLYRHTGNKPSICQKIFITILGKSGREPVQPGQILARYSTVTVPVQVLTGFCTGIGTCTVPWLSECSYNVGLGIRMYARVRTVQALCLDVSFPFFALCLFVCLFVCSFVWLFLCFCGFGCGFCCCYCTVLYCTRMLFVALFLLFFVAFTCCFCS